MEENKEPNGDMKACFGVSFGWFMEDMVGDEKQREKCYRCPDFDRCQKMALVRALTQLRFEIRRSAAGLGRAIGGSHSAYPFG